MLLRKKLRIDGTFLFGVSGRRFASIFISCELAGGWDDISLDAGLMDGCSWGCGVDESPSVVGG